jgi:hypothetical protein
MDFVLELHKQPHILILHLLAPQPEQIEILAIDAEHTQTVYINVEFQIKGRNVIQLPLPLTPQSLAVQVNCKSKVQSYEVQKTQIQLPEDKKLRNFISEMFEFCQKVDYLDLGIYQDDATTFYISLTDVILDGNGNEVPTPAAVFMDTGNIEIAKPLFTEMSVAGQIFTVLHEYAHYYLQTEDEQLCDEFALNEFIKMGFPAYEAIIVLEDFIPGTYENKLRIFELQKEWQQQQTQLVQ